MCDSGDVRYDRITRIDHRLERRSERRFASARADRWRRARAPRVLAVGVGTGKHTPFSPRDAQVTAIDLSPRMLAWALLFPNAACGTAVASFVFCSVPDPVLSLRECKQL